MLSWVGGYAVCARLAGQLYGAGRITRRDAALLQVLGCCSGPGFVIGCVGGALLGNVRLGVVLYTAQIGANLGAGAVCQLLSHIVGANTVRPLAVSDVGDLSGKHSHANLTGEPCSTLRLHPGGFGAQQGSLSHPLRREPPRRGGQGVAAGHILRGHVVAVGLRVRCILPHSGRCAAGSAAVAAYGCQRGAGGQRRMRGLCGAGRGGGAVRLLRLSERARRLGLGAAAAVCRGGVPPAAASFQPRGAPCTFAAARQGVCAAAARQMLRHAVHWPPASCRFSVCRRTPRRRGLSFSAQPFTRPGKVFIILYNK